MEAGSTATSANPWYVESTRPVRVAGLGTAAGDHWVPSDESADFLASLWPELNGRARRLLRQSGSEGRFLSRPVADLVEALPFSRQGPMYAQVALTLATRAARLALKEADCDPGSIGALIVVSCTGFALPGLDVQLVFQLGLRRDAVRMPFTQLGCAGGAMGLARAADWVRGEADRTALVVAVEVPSLTFRPADRSLDNLLGALVFGDGAGAAVLGRGDPVNPSESSVVGPPVLHLGRTREVLIPDSEDALGYQLADDGFRVILSRRLPQLIEGGLAEMVASFLPGVPPSTLEVLAVHPGGSAILEAVQSCLAVGPDQLAASWTTFRKVGNTSSAAIFFVLEEVGRQQPAAGGRGLALAFGPGLTVGLLELAWLG